jgi:hypothetical protein
MALAVNGAGGEVNGTIEMRPAAVGFFGTDR